MNPFKSALTLTFMLMLGLCSFTATAEDNGNMTSAPAMDHQHVARAVFTSGVENREPVDTITTLSNDKDKIYFFTDLRGLGGQTVTHRWEYQGKTVSEVKFNVGGPRWRVWTSKNIPVKWVGPWVIEVVDEDENVLTQKLFYYSP